MKLMKRSVLFLIVVLSLLLLSSCIFEPEEPKEEVIYAQSDVAAGDKYTVQIMGVTETQLIPSLSDFRTENRYLIVEVRITNHTTMDATFSASDFTVSDGTHSFDHLSTEAYWYGKDRDVPGLSYVETVKEGLSSRFYLVFEVPESVQSREYFLTIEYPAFDGQVKFRINALTA